MEGEMIGLIAAMTSESAALLRLVRGWQRTVFGPFRGAKFCIGNRQILLVSSGMGFARAAQAAQALQSVTRLNLLVSFGIAGAVQDDLDIGDVVIPGAVCLLEEKGLPGPRQPLVALSPSGWEAAACQLQLLGAHLVVGTAITTHGSQLVLPTATQAPHPILEMETAGIAQVAAREGIPLLSIRSISDGPRAPVPIDLAAVMDENCHFRMDRLLLQLLRHPRIILRSRRMLRNSAKAAANAAGCLLAILSQPGPILINPGRTT